MPTRATERINFGKIKEIIEYCKNDVIITRALFDFALKNKYLIYEKKNGPVVQLPLDWDLKEILSQRALGALKSPQISFT